MAEFPACILRRAAMISYAQNFEDVMLWRVFHHLPCGFYVDVGAFHPEIDSVTKWFYDQGWSGVNIEPVPESFATLEAARPRDTNVRAAAGAATHVAELTVFPNSKGLSSLHPTVAQNEALGEAQLVEVQVLPLRDILQPYSNQQIHFLKIDAEGSEREVLLGMDFARFRPWIVLIEATEPLSSTRSSDTWSSILTENGYELVYFDGLNDFFLASERRELARHFRVPPNVFDDFELVALLREREALLSEREALSALRLESGAKIAAAHQHIASLQDELHRVSDQLAASQAAVAKLSGDVSELAESLKTARTQLDAVFRSRSWRWLEPIRKANFLLKSYRKKLRAAQMPR